MTKLDLGAWVAVGVFLALAAALHARDWLRNRKHRAGVAQLRPPAPVITPTQRSR